MEKYLLSPHFDLATPDGGITKINFIDSRNAEAIVKIKNISPLFVGYDIDHDLVQFNLKSVLAQLGINGVGTEYHLDHKNQMAEVKVHLMALDSIGEEMLALLNKGCLIGKLFAADDRRRVRDPIYIRRMFGRFDQEGRPLLFLGSPQEGGELVLEKIEGRTVAFIPLKDGVLTYTEQVKKLLPTVAKALRTKNLPLRDFLHLYQIWGAGVPTVVKKHITLLVRTEPLHVRTVFAKVEERLLPPGYHHTAANILQPDTMASGDVYEFYGVSNIALKEVPLEFYTLEPYREYVFFADRDQLQEALENPTALFNAFKTSGITDKIASVFIVKEQQLKNLKSKDWIAKEIFKHDFPGVTHPVRQAFLVDKYIKQQPSYPFLKAIEDNVITSQGVLLCTHFPSPLLKRMLISDAILRCLKGIYFQHPSKTNGYYFSHEDRAFLIDLAKFGIPVYWVDEVSNKILQYTVKSEKDSGMFVPLYLVESFRKATFFGIYGSHSIEGQFEDELKKLLHGVIKLKDEVDHPLLGPDTPLALVTGGGAGAMEVGNRIAQELNIISCANIVDFSKKGGSLTDEQSQNPHVEAKMTYRLEHLVERQAEFHLDFSICIIGGIGTDFEYALEEVGRKVGAVASNPVLLFGEPDYWRQKITSRFKCNIANKTIVGSEWVSNCFYCVQTAKQGLTIYKEFFKNTLPIGPNGPIYEDGFCIVPPID